MPKRYIALISAGMFVAAFIGYVAGISSVRYGLPPSRIGSISTLTQNQQARDALRSLKDLRAAVSGGITFTEYSKRLVDTRIAVDHYLEAAPPTSEVTILMKEAVDLYSVASSAWSDQITQNWGKVVNDPRIDLCPEVSVKRDRNQAKPLTQRGIEIAFAVQLFWACADDRLAKIEQRL